MQLESTLPSKHFKNIRNQINNTKHNQPKTTYTQTNRTTLTNSHLRVKSPPSIRHTHREVIFASQGFQSTFSSSSSLTTLSGCFCGHMVNVFFSIQTVIAPTDLMGVAKNMCLKVKNVKIKWTHL